MRIRIRSGRQWVMAALLAIPTRAVAADWPRWGGRPEINFVSGETGMPLEFQRAIPLSADESNKAARNVLWSVELGTQTYSTPAVSKGRIYIGTNDARLAGPRLKKTKGGLILCLDEATGRQLWQLPVPRLKTRNKQFNFNDMNLGICSSPMVDGNRVYLVSNRGEVLCLDTMGQANGNDGPYVDEGRYIVNSATLPDKPGLFDPKDGPPPPEPVDLLETDGDIIWRFDMLTDLGVWSQDAADCSIVMHGEHLFVCTSIGVDKSHKRIPSPNAPDLVVLDRKTGALLATNDVPIGHKIFHGEWSSPTLAHVDGRTLVIWGGGDGVCYAYDTNFKPGPNGQPGTLKKVWWFDCNPRQYRVRDGKPLPYNKNHEGPSEIIATPVCVKNRVYLTVGQDSRHGDGPGSFSCIDATGRGDITKTGCVWQSREVHRSMSSAAVAKGLVFMADYAGGVYCFDADTGELYWQHKVRGHIFASPMAVDEKVYMVDDKGWVTVFALEREKRVLAVNRLGAGIFTTPVPANGTLFIATGRQLFALRTNVKN